jgi:hypothetical protein
MLSRILMILAASAAILAAAQAQSGSDTLSRQKVLMGMEGFEKDTVLKHITYRDAARLDAYEAVRANALDEAKAGGTSQDVKALEEIVSRPALSIADFDLTGEWQCRTVKAGGLAALVFYDWFRCRVTDDGSGWALEKLSGSQRTKGRFFTEDDTRLIYLGSFFVAGEAPPAYGAGGETDQAGYVFRDGEDTWRIEFPAPARESKLDILEFRRPG